MIPKENLFPDTDGIKSLASGKPGLALPAPSDR